MMTPLSLANAGMNAQSQSITIATLETPPASCAELFQRAFNGAIPDTPIHYVAFAGDTPVGYYHITRTREYALIGGLCVEERYRRLKLASKLVAAAHRDADGLPGFFGYCGNPASYKLLTDAGYRDTEYPYLIVHWTHAPALADRQRIVADVARLGPF